MDGSLRGARRSGGGGAEEVTDGFGEEDFHDGFAVAGGRNGASFGVGITTAADERRIADTAGKFAAGAAGGSSGVQTALVVESDGADGALLVATMMFRSVRVLTTALPGFAFGGRDKLGGIAERNTLLMDEALRAGGNEHHVRAFFEDCASSLNGVFDPMKTGDGTSTERRSIHDDGIALDIAIEIEMRTVAGIEDRIIFEDGDGRFNRIERVATVGKDGPAGVESSKATGFAWFDGVVGNVPGSAVENERRAHE